MKAQYKASIVDKYLYPMRSQLVAMVAQDTSVLDVGCGNGDLLIRLADKIKKGIGIDIDELLLKDAVKRLEKAKISNLSFQKLDIRQASFTEFEVDTVIISLVLHVLPWEKAQSIIKDLLKQCNNFIVCGFSEPKSSKQKFLLWLDQRFTSHYSHFSHYKKMGFTEGLLQSIDGISYNAIATFDPVIKIYQISRRKEVKGVGK